MIACLFFNFFLFSATGKPPWQEFTNNLAALFHVATSKHPPPIPSMLSQECTHFIERLVKYDYYYYYLNNSCLL